MDWGLITLILVVAVLAVHIAFDARTLLKNLRSLGHQTSPQHYGPELHNTQHCERCHTIIRGHKELRHEAAWTAAALIILVIHIALDFMRLG